MGRLCFFAVDSVGWRSTSFSVMIAIYSACFV